MRRDRGRHRHRRRRRDPRAAPRPARASTTSSKRSIARIPPPQRRSRRAAAGADHRLLVRQLRRRRDAGARDEGRRCKPKRQDPADGDRRARTWCEQVGVFTPKSRRRATRWRRARWASSSPASRSCTARQVGDTVTLGREPAAGAAAGLQGSASRRCSPACIPVEANEYEALRDALEKLQAQRRVAALRARGVAGARASASAAASSACCTWRSCRSGSSASTTWT